MRALHLIPGNLYGGVETFLSLVARRRDLAGEVEHHYATCFDGRLSEELAAAGVPLHRLGRIRTSRPWTVIRGRLRLARLLEQQRFDVALTHSSWPHAMFAPVLVRAGVPNVFYLHGPITDVAWIDRWAARYQPSLMIAVSRDTLATGRLLFPVTRAEVLNYPIPWQSASDSARVRAEVRAELATPASEVVLLQASRADRWKGHDQLIAALERIRDVPGWRLWLAGGAQRPHELAFLEQIRAQVKRAGLDERVHFLGERRDVPRLLAGADLYCQANVGPEGFSLAFMEAFSAGLPVVTMRLGGAPEMIDETSGVLVPPRDIDGFARALRELVTDGDRRRALGRRAKERVHELCDTGARLADLGRILTNVASARPGA